MSVEILQLAIDKGAKLYASVSGGKDGQAMVKSLLDNGHKITGLIHADLGRIEWPESLPMCETLSTRFNIPLHVVTRSDGAGLVEHWQRRLQTLKGQNKPFWSSSSSRYCTSDLKRAPIDKFLNSTGHKLIISCEGIRADESAARSKKEPFTVRHNSSSFYKGMTVEEALANFRPDKKLILTYYPIFNYTTEDVWNTYGLKSIDLIRAQEAYAHNCVVPSWWSFHPAYVYGNQRVSCMFCVLGSLNDLQVGAAHNPGLLQELVDMEKESGFTFKSKFSLASLNVNKQLTSCKTVNKMFLTSHFLI